MFLLLGAANQCSQSRSAVPVETNQNILTQLIINEVYFTGSVNDARSIMEYVELKGPPNTPINNYYLVTWSQSGNFFSKALTDQETHTDGIVTIATDNMTPPPDFTAPEYTFLPRGTGAVALYRDVSDIDLMFADDISRYNDKLIDALVFTDDISMMSNQLSSSLTPESTSFYPSDLR